MSNIDSVNGVSSANNVAKNTNAQSKTEGMMGGLDSDAYLTLFLASLKNQDPTSAMNTSEMMQQLSMLSQMQAIYDLQGTVEDMKEGLVGSQIQQTAGFLGKEITAIKSDGTLVQGVAEEMNINGDLISLLVEGKTVTIGEIKNVSISDNKGGDLI